MNPNLTFKYNDEYNPNDGHYTRCQVGVANSNGAGFISLGLETGQTTLNQKQLDWFEKNGDEVVETVTALDNAKAGDRHVPFNRWDKLMDRFTTECDIKNT